MITSEERARLLTFITEEELATEENRLNLAEGAGARVARFDMLEGMAEPRDWSKDGDPYAGAYSHLAAAGFTRYGTRGYVLPFINSYLQTFAAATLEDAQQQVRQLQQRLASADTCQHAYPERTLEDAATSFTCQRCGSEVAYW